MKGANNNTITIIVTYILAVVYCLLFLNSIIKIKILGKFGKDAHVARLFFICLSSQVFLDTLFYSLLPSSNSSQIISILLLQLPSSLNMFTYSLLFLQTLDYTFKTHLQLGSTFKRDKRRLQFHKYTYIGVITIMIAYVLVELTFFIIILIYPSHQEVFMLQLASITLVFVVCYGGIIIYQVIYFSGTPFKSTTEQLKMKRLLWVFSLWTLCQIPKPILSLAKVNIIPDPDNIPNDQDLKQAVCIFILQIMTEVMPFLLSMEGNFLSIFTTAFKVQDVDNSLSEGLHQVIQTQIVSEQELLNHIAHEGTEDHEYQVQFTKEKLISTEIARQIQILQDIKIVVSPEDVQKIKAKLLIDKKDFTLLETIMPRQRGKLATLHKAVLKGEEVLCKVIYSDRINNFLVEDFLETVVKLSYSPVKANLMPVLGYFFDEQAFYLFTPQKISLYTLLHEFETSRRPIDLHKFFIIEELSRILFALHSIDPSIIHGHISSHNVFVEPDFQHNYKVYLGDMELSPFIKFGTLFCDYQPWSVWSSPEILSQAPKILEPTKQMDSYSFGMLLWEIFHNQVPFGNDLALTRDYVLKQHARPQISENVGSEMAKLIRLCWLTNPDQRFQFSSIYSKLRQE